MDRITAVLRCQWRAYWRRFARSANLNANNQGVLLIIALLSLFKFVSALRVASAQLASGRTSLLEVLLLGVFLAWLFPLISNSRLSVTTRSLKHLPFKTTELLVIRSASLLIPPFSWLIVGASVAIIYPIIFAPSPFPGIVASFLFIAFSWLFGLTLAHLLTIALWRRVAVVAVVVGSLISLYLVNVRSWRASDALPFMPASLVASAVVGNKVWFQLLVLSLSVAIAACTAIWSFQLSLDNVESSGTKSKTYFSLFRGKTGPLSGKDVRYFRRLFDPYLGLLVSGLGCFYLVAAPVPTAEVLWIVILGVMLPNAPLAFNAFGLDSASAADRYSLLPLSGEEIIWSKNLAYCATVAIQTWPVFILGALRIGIGAVALAFVELLLLLLGYLSFGNMVSVNHRTRMQFYRFSSGGSPVESLVGVIFGTLPGVIALQLFHGGIWWVSLVVLILYATMYTGSLLWAAKQWRRRRPEAWSN